MDHVALSVILAIIFTTAADKLSEKLKRCAFDGFRGICGCRSRAFHGICDVHLLVLFPTSLPLLFQMHELKHAAYRDEQLDIV
jgi:hypothetical protein